MNLGQNTQLKAGINTIFVHDITIDSGQYGKQMVISLGRVPKSKVDDKTIVNKLWVSFKKSFPEDKAFGFRNKLNQYCDFIAGFLPNAEEIFDSVYEEMSMVNFDNTSDESVQNFEALFVEKLLANLPKNFGDIPVKGVFHYGTFKNGVYYLSAAKYKENGYNLSIGKNPVVGPNLILNKPVVQAEAISEEDHTEQGTATETQAESDDLPF